MLTVAQTAAVARRRGGWLTVEGEDLLALVSDWCRLSLSFKSINQAEARMTPAMYINQG
jgi:hypothetical protein